MIRIRMGKMYVKQSFLFCLTCKLIEHKAEVKPDDLELKGVLRKYERIIVVKVSIDDSKQYCIFVGVLEITVIYLRSDNIKANLQNKLTKKFSTRQQKSGAR